VRVVPNRFPAVSGPDGRSEVVVHSPRHVLSLADLSPDEIGGVATAWRERAAAARASGVRYVHALVNEGWPAGGSLPHSHSQLVWLHDVPPTVAGETAALPGLATMLAQELAEGERVVAELDGLVALCPPAGRAPYELLIAPLAAEGDGLASERLGDALALLSRAVLRLRELEGETALNAWLHTSSLGETAGHWHLELVPRLTVAAGLELGAGVYVNPLPPEEAAARLRPL